MVTGVAVGASGTLSVALAPNIATVLVGWCLCQVFFNATLAAQAAVLPDQVPSQQRGLVSGLIGLTVPCAVGGLAVLLFTWRLPDRRLAPADKPPWSLRELGRTFYVSPRRNPDFAWAFLSRFLLVTAYAFLITYQAYYLIAQVGSSEDAVPRPVYLGTVTQSIVLVAIAPVAGRLSDGLGRRKVFVMSAAVIYAGALFAIASTVSGYLVGMGIGGLGFGMYMAVDLHSSWTFSLTRTPPPRTSASSTSRAPCPLRWLRPWLQPCCLSAATATRFSSPSPGPARSWEPWPSCRCEVSDEALPAANASPVSVRGWPRFARSPYRSSDLILAYAEPR